MEEKKGLIKTKKQSLIVIGVFTLVMLLGTVTYAFFNYTRTGSQNIIKTGRIYFNSEQGTAINLTNMFPIATTETGVMDDATKVGTVTINVIGDTTYSDGIEYLVSAVNVQNTTGNKQLPISIQVSVEDNNDNDPSTSLGTSDTDYFTNRGTNVQTSIYKVLASDVIKNNNQLVVGYIKSGQDGVDGNIVIKAYIDKNKVVISDTYPSGNQAELNSSMTAEELNECVSYLTSQGLDNELQTGETLNAFCAGTGTVSGITFQDGINLGLFNENQMSYFVSHNIVNDLGENGTPASFGEGKTVLTTTEWNGLQTNGVSFQVKVEANEGVWVEEPANGTIESCQGCKFLYVANTPMYTTWNNQSETPTEITSGYSENYNDIVISSVKNYFLGVKLNSNNEVTNAYVCGVKENGLFCIEGTSDGSKYSANQTLLQGANLYNNTCTVSLVSAGASFDITKCGPWDNSGSISANAYSDGSVFAGVDPVYGCNVGSNGYFGCSEFVGQYPGAGAVVVDPDN